MFPVYIAIGSNLDSPTTKTQLAIAALKILPKSYLISVSSLYSSKPMGPADQPDYVNAVVLIKTELSPLALLDETQAIENKLGRERKIERWGPRTIDLDILLYGNQFIENERLTVPHYDMKKREFVLYPLFELTPELRFPDGELLSDCLHKVNKNNLVIISN